MANSRPHFPDLLPILTCVYMVAFDLGARSNQEKISIPWVKSYRIRPHLITSTILSVILALHTSSITLSHHPLFCGFFDVCPPVMIELYIGHRLQVRTYGSDVVVPCRWSIIFGSGNQSLARILWMLVQSLRSQSNWTSPSRHQKAREWLVKCIKGDGLAKPHIENISISSLTATRSKNRLRNCQVDNNHVEDTKSSTDLT